jgi:hypothetical protein
MLGSVNVFREKTLISMKIAVTLPAVKGEIFGMGYKWRKVRGHAEGDEADRSSRKLKGDFCKCGVRVGPSGDAVYETNCTECTIVVLPLH